ncbi:5-(carboxyamino)imidazole ribonucleotide synthase [Cellulosilyticum sp. I15G10I2]|uniref:5-(carboxyamino)imidazole ribonucleotide synthase n=1 Tax=Cellulosilyticum sp. I15G10I2 TaxID=1892843 RepID=UPI00085C2C5F|nr:5-(carboxyamino)imidazole ribonucleotide synthase [Cellulosilyticum sp. I15G10I2]
MNAREIKRLAPPSTIGIVGGGQLGRMMAHEAKRMGYNVIVLDPKPNAPTGQVADEQITADFSDLAALRQLAARTDVLTYEFEHIDVELLSILENEGYTIYPSARTLRMIQNKFVQKNALKEAGIPVPNFYTVNSLEELTETFDKLGGKLVLKSCTGGYDGKGNAIIKHRDQLETAYQMLSGYELMAEEFVDYIKEVSIIVAKNHEKIVFYPVAENSHKDSILIHTIVPAGITEKVEEKIQEAAQKVIETINDYGIFCIEFFVDIEGNILVNEIAPRPHNSGHYSIEGCITSQFEQIIRVITGMPLGSTKLRSVCAMYNLLGSEDVDGAYCIDGVENILEMEDCHFHLYGKADTKPLKKIGHITALGETGDLALLKAREALYSIQVKPVEEERSNESTR